MQPSDSFKQGENKIKLINKYSNKCKKKLVIKFHICINYFRHVIYTNPTLDQTV